MADFYKLARQCAPSVAPTTLAAIAKVESGFQPLVIHDNRDGKVRVFVDEAQSVTAANALLGAGHSIDLGMMQINSANLPLLGLTLNQVFDPCASLTAAGDLLVSAYSGGDTEVLRQQALRQAISVYNTGDRGRGFKNGYVTKVELASRELVPALSEATPQVQSQSQPDAPPVWDVWGSYQYEQSKVLPDTPKVPRRGPRIVPASQDRRIFEQSNGASNDQEDH